MNPIGVAVPVSFPSGVTPFPQNNMLAGTPLLFPQQGWSGVYTDFAIYATAPWTLTDNHTTTGGSVTAANFNSGAVLMAMGETTSGSNLEFQLKGEAFQFISGYALAFNSTIALPDQTNSEVLVGLQPTNTAPLSATDGVWFHKASGGTTVDFIVKKGGTATTVSSVIDLATVGKSAAATATVVGGVITAITVTNNGTGWQNRAPLVNITDGTGSGATAIAILGPNGTLTVNVTAGGSSYSSTPTISFTPVIEWGFAYGASTGTQNAMLAYGFGQQTFGAINTANGGSLANLPTGLLTPTFYLKNGSAAAQSMYIGDMLCIEQNP